MTLATTPAEAAVPARRSPTPDYANRVRMFEKSAAVGGFENGWHHDVSWRECPSMGAILRAIRVPPSSDDTLCADMVAAYEGLADDVKPEIDGLAAVHDFITAQHYASSDYWPEARVMERASIIGPRPVR